MNDMDHMLISGTEHSSVMTKKCQNKLKPKGMVQ